MNYMYDAIFNIAAGVWLAYESTTWTHNAPVRKLTTTFLALANVCVGLIKLGMHFGYIIKV